MARTLSSTLSQVGGASVRRSAFPIWRSIPDTALTTLPEGLISEVLLLAGDAGPKGFRAQVGRNLLDLPVSGGRRLVDLWAGEVAKLSDYFGWQRLPVRVLIDSKAVAPRGIWDQTPGIEMSIERDGQAYRGSGGVIRDACREPALDRYVLVCNAHQVLAEPLSRQVENLLGLSADLAFSMEPCGGPAGLFLMAGRCIEDIPAIGFVDFKEQALSLIARKHSVRVAGRTMKSGLPVRNLDEYIGALRYQNLREGGEVRTGFSIVEEGAIVSKSARLHDAVVLKGGRVESHAIVAESVVGLGGVVEAGRHVVHSVVGGVTLGR
jgi:hypothetical protein